MTAGRYHERGYINPSLPVLECARCGALVVGDPEDYARRNHDDMHDRLEAALSAAQGSGMTDNGQPIARKRRNRERMTYDEGRALLRAAQADFERARDAYNHAIHERAKAAHICRRRGEMVWPSIGEALGIGANSAQELAGRYAAAIARHDTLHVYEGANR